MSFKKALDEVKLFDEKTAKNLRAHAGDLDHKCWELEQHVKNYISKISSEEQNLYKYGLDVVSQAGFVRGGAFTNFKNILRVYQVSGVILSKKIAKEWIEEKFIPEHYKSIGLLLAQSKIKPE